MADKSMPDSGPAAIAAIQRDRPSVISARLFAPSRVDEVTEVAPGVTRTTSGWFWTFSGSIDALLAAGLVQTGSLPGDKGQGKSFGQFERDGRNLRAFLLGRGRRQTLAVHVEFTSSDLRARDDRAELETAREYEARELGRLAPSRDAYRKEQDEMARFILRAFRGQLASSASGFSYSPAAIEEFDDKAYEIFELLKTAPIRFNESVRADAVAGIKSKTAKADKGFTAFLGPVLANATTEADHG